MAWWEYFYNPAMFEWDPVWNNNLNFAWLLVLAAGLYFTRTPGRAGRRRLLAFVAYSVFMEYVTTNDHFKALLGLAGNAPLYHALTPGLFLVMIRLFAPALFGARSGRWVVRLTVAFVVVALLAASTQASWREFPTVAASLYALAGVACCLGYFVRLLVLPARGYLERNPLFWVAAAGLVYYSGSVLVLAAVNYIDYDYEFFQSVYIVYHLLTLVFLLALLIAFALPAPPPPETTQSNPRFDLPRPAQR